MKHLKGKTVFMIPTGNNARYDKDRIFTAEVVNVARVFITIKLNGSHYESKLRMGDGHRNHHLDEGHNSGYIYFETMQELEDHKKTLKLADMLSNKIRYNTDLIGLGLDKLMKIAAIIELDND